MPEDEILWVRIAEARPNKMFSEEQRASVCFLHWNKAVPCAECGKRRRVQWTLICEFMAHTMAPFVPLRSGLVHAPLTGVCTAHLLAPAWPEREKEAS